MKKDLQHLIIGLSLAGTVFMGSMTLFAQKDHVESIFQLIFKKLNVIDNDIKTLLRRSQ